MFQEAPNLSAVRSVYPGDMDMPLELPLAVAAMADLGARCAVLMVVWSLFTTAVVAAAGAALGVLVGRPLLAWGVGPSRAGGCLAVTLMLVGGGLGGLWAGAFLGGDRCAHMAVEDRLLLEDLGLRAALAAAGGDFEGDPADNVAALEQALDVAGGELEQLFGEISVEIRAELDDPELEALLGPETLEQLAAEIRASGLAEPERLARAAAVGGFGSALTDPDPDQAAWARQLVDATRPVRSEILLAVDALAAANVVGGLLAGLGTPLLLLALAALAGRLVRGRPVTPAARGPSAAS